MYTILHHVHNWQVLFIENQMCSSV